MLDKIKRTFGFIFSHPLASRKPLKATVQFLIWQLQSRLFPNKHYKRTFGSSLKVWVNKGQTGMTGNIYTGLHEFEDMGFLLHFLRPEDTFIDAGANVGSYTLLASGLAGARSLTFEPVPSTFRILESNIKLNQLNDMVKCLNMGLSSKTGTLQFSTEDDTTNHVLTEGNSNSIKVQVCPLDEISSTTCPSLIKIDVEGYETEVLNGSELILNNPILKAIIIELNGSGDRYGFKDMDIHNKLKRLGFLPNLYDPLSRSLIIAESFGDKNTIYVRDTGFVSNRIKASKKYEIFGIEF